MEKSVIPVEARRIVVPDDVYIALEEYAAESRKGVKDKVLSGIFTAKSAAQSVLRAEMIRRGFLKPRGK